MISTIAFLVLVSPAFGALLLAGRGWRLPRLVTKIVGPGAVWLSFLLVMGLLFNQLLNHSPANDFSYWTWAQTGRFNIPFNLLVDNLSIFMCLVITGVGGLIVTYSIGYMSHENDPSFARFFCYMDLFIFSMLLLVLAGNFVFLIVGWALVGLSSFLLIGFWYQRKSAVLAARKAFVMNVIGDVGMILGAFVLFTSFHQTTFNAVFKALPQSDNGTLELAAFLLLIGAVAKSAQLPLHTWLPDAMEGPTPVSALIHAATMVTAGVYLIGRLHPIYDLATIAHHTVAIIGATTAIFAATIALVQVDIKRVLAYSTMSQIGYMFLAVGIGAYSAGFFHLISHAFFKALLFMAAGNIIHALHDEQDMRRYGGLWQQMRTTAICFLIGSLALAGILPFVGFWSKESILGDAFSKPGDPISQLVWLVGFITAVLTAFYTGRMWWMSFWGHPDPSRTTTKPQEVPYIMLIPVAILAGLSTIGGFIQINALYHNGWQLIGQFLEPVVGTLDWEPGAIEYLPTLATLVLAIGAFGLSYYFYGQILLPAKLWQTKFVGIYQLLSHKYYFDDIYDRLFVQPMNCLAQKIDKQVDKPLIDGAVEGLASLTQRTAKTLSLTQNGYLRSYLLVFSGGAALLALIIAARLWL